MARLIRKLKDEGKEARARWRRASIARRLPTRRVSADPAIVIAPHPDDETFGTGGMIALKRAANVPVTVVLLTYGEASLTRFSEVSPEVVGRARRNQAIAAACLGLDSTDVVGLGLADGKIPRDGEPGFEEAVARLAGERDRRAASEIYCPHPHDGLPDHEAAAGIALNAANQAGRPPRIVFYVVWAWFNARAPLRARLNLETGWRLDVRPVYGQKQAAVAQYLDGEPAPRAHPYCGYLPRAVIRSATARNEIYFDHVAENPGPSMAVRRSGTSA